jgi:hypothetical protein
MNKSPRSSMVEHTAVKTFVSESLYDLGSIPSGGVKFDIL